MKSLPKETGNNKVISSRESQRRCLPQTVASFSSRCVLPKGKVTLKTISMIHHSSRVYEPGRRKRICTWKTFVIAIYWMKNSVSWKQKFCPIENTHRFGRIQLNAISIPKKTTEDPSKAIKHEKYTPTCSFPPIKQQVLKLSYKTHNGFRLIHFERANGLVSRTEGSNYL